MSEVEPVEVRRPIGDNPATATLFYGASCIDSLRRLPENSVHCMVTSPPYWGLRNYLGEPQVWGGEPDCDHVWDAKTKICERCDGWLGQFGLEPTPELYTRHLVEIFREIWRVLREDGTAWLNLGDSYARGRVGRDDQRRMATDAPHWRRKPTGPSTARRTAPDLKEKDLVGVPWRAAFALQADGWYLRSEIIWNKLNPLPESVRDRVTRAHEQIFMLAKKPHYFYDHDAIKEAMLHPDANVPAGFGGTKRSGESRPGISKSPYSGNAYDASKLNGRNKRSVWTMPTKPYRGAHFAVMPPRLIEPCVLAGTSEKGCCPMCGAPWERVVEASGGRDWRDDVMEATGIPGELGGEGSYKRGRSKSALNDTQTRTTTGWQPTCGCPEHEPIPCKVLDPFSGSGTTGVVSLDHGRDYVGLDINADYLELATARLLGEDAPVQSETDEGGGILEFLGVEEE